MTSEEKAVMEQFGITSEEKVIFHFQGHKYDRLDDALKYAKIQMGNTESLGSKPTE